MRFEFGTEDREIIDFYDKNAHLEKLSEELDELKQAISWYRIAISEPFKENKTYRKRATARFLEEFADVAIKMRHVYEKIIRPSRTDSEMCNLFEKYKLARQMVRMGLRDESFGPSKKKN